MSFKDIADIINEYTDEDKQVNKPEKSKDSRAFELFLQGNLIPLIHMDCSSSLLLVESQNIQSYVFVDHPSIHTIYQIYHYQVYNALHRFDPPKSYICDHARA
jgi:hypothetical protein